MEEGDNEINGVNLQEINKNEESPLKTQSHKYVRVKANLDTDPGPVLWSLNK